MRSGSLWIGCNGSASWRRRPLRTSSPAPRPAAAGGRGARDGVLTEQPAGRAVQGRERRPAAGGGPGEALGNAGGGEVGGGDLGAGGGGRAGGEERADAGAGDASEDLDVRPPGG